MTLCCVCWVDNYISIFDQIKIIFSFLVKVRSLWSSLLRILLMNPLHFPGSKLEACNPCFQMSNDDVGVCCLSLFSGSIYYPTDKTLHVQPVILSFNLVFDIFHFRPALICQHVQLHDYLDTEGFFVKLLDILDH